MKLCQLMKLLRKVYNMFRESINEAMKIRKVKAKDLADYIGVTKSSMSLFLNGKRAMGQEKIEAMLKHLRINLVIEA